jgi:uncharacterized surface protein with fasciclin (FAS1) repeats
MRKLLTLVSVFLTSLAICQTNVYDDVIATSPNHTYLKAAIDQEGLASALQDGSATLTVFAPSNVAFDSLASSLNTNIAGLLALPNLSDVLLYHVLGTTAPSSALSNGDIVTPLNMANTIKLTVAGSGDVYANHALVEIPDLTTDNGVVHSTNRVLLPSETVVDVAIDNGFSTLASAVIAAELLPALTDPFGTYTVFAPTNDAFDDLASELSVPVSALLLLPNLADILTYHVLGSEVASTAINNGDVVSPLSATNTLKLTVTSMGGVFVNQASVASVDIPADNGVVHILESVVLPVETVVDVALDNGFSTLATAVITAELLPVLTDPMAEYTVFAPTNEAFDNLASALGTDIAGLLALPNLTDILTYHVLDGEVAAAAINNGDIVEPFSTTNSLKLTKTSTGDVFVNQAQVTSVDIASDNGIVHVLNGVVLPSETVVDVAIDNGFTSLATAVVTAELLPALTDPLAEYTVFAPTNEAFDNLAAALGTDIAGLLALEDLATVLLHHVVSGTVLSTDLVAGTVPTLSGLDVQVDLTNGVMINSSTVTTADVTAENGVVHIVDRVIMPYPLGNNEVDNITLDVYPNPATDFIQLAGAAGKGSVTLFDITGKMIFNETNVALTNALDVSGLTSGAYIMKVEGEAIAPKTLKVIIK